MIINRVPFGFRSIHFSLQRSLIIINLDIRKTDFTIIIIIIIIIIFIIQQILQVLTKDITNKIKTH